VVKMDILEIKREMAGNKEKLEEIRGHL